MNTTEQKPTEQKQQHTPGPWAASEPDGTYHDVIRIHAGGRELPVAICPQQASAVLQVLSGETNETTEAACNARLIAAAPELLEALKRAEVALEDAFQQVMDGVSEPMELEESLDNARAACAKAIAKATGA